MVDRVENQSTPAGWKLSARWCDADEQRVWSTSEAVGERAHDRNRSAEAEDLLRRLTGARGIDDRHDLFGRVADARVGRFRAKGTERAFGENEKTRIHRR